jgi:molecular chaperone GrpE (heat shock protein)
MQRFGAIARDYDLSILAQAEPDGDVTETVAIEAATGFLMHNRVVRPSQVVVSTGSPPK